MRFCCLPAGNNGLQKYFFIILNIRHKVCITIYSDYHYPLTRIFLLIWVIKVIQELAFLKIKNDILKTDSSELLKH